jgi:hypothetical protein
MSILILVVAEWALLIIGVALAEYALNRRVKS